jgi:hypothetical protein
LYRKRDFYDYTTALALAILLSAVEIGSWGGTDEILLSYNPDTSFYVQTLTAWYVRVAGAYYGLLQVVQGIASGCYVR